MTLILFLFILWLCQGNDEVPFEDVDDNGEPVIHSEEF
jgi:hypothetical protein